MLPPLTRRAHPNRAFLRLTRTTTQSPSRRPASSFQTGPAPPRLPADQQAEFERLQRQAATAAPLVEDGTPPSAGAHKSAVDDAAAAAAAQVDGVVGIRRGAPAEFTGDVNPKTGEVGGPKNEPLRWGAKGDYSFNGRVTDF